MSDMATILCGDAVEMLAKHVPDQSVDCVVTSPPYWGLRDYGVDGQIGREKSPEAYVAVLLSVFREVRRTLREDGTLWLNLGDSYAQNGSGGHGATGGADKSTLASPAPFGACPVKRTIPVGYKQKDLIGLPWMVAFALRADGWYLRCDIIWSKPNPMPESVKDRPTRAHEYIFLFSKSKNYFYDADAIKEKAIYFGLSGQESNGFKDAMTVAQQCSGMRNKRSVWTVATSPYKWAHFATFPPDLIKPCVLAGSPSGGIVLDPFCGSGTTGKVAIENGREFIGIELNPEYLPLIKERLQQPGLRL